MEARQKLADIAQGRGDAARRAALLDDIIKADQGAGAARTDRSRYLAARASLELARPTRDAFNAVRLVLPLKKSLEAKRAAMQRALKAFEAADAYAIAEVSTAATYEMAELYRQLSVDLLKSERPKSLAGEELEQYDLLLEEQAYPFEEKAIDIHLVNATRAAQGLYDDSVRASFGALAKLKPARFGKTEQNEDLVIDAAAGALAAAAPAPAPAAGTTPGKAPPPPTPAGVAVPLQVATRFQEAVAAADRGGTAQADAEFVALQAAAPTLAGPPLNHGILLSRAQQWPEAAAALGEALQRNPSSATAAAQLGVVYRQLGKFADAEQSYRRALELDANDARTHRNFGVLLDLYLQKPTEALTQYESALALAGGEDKQMSAWIAELRQRLGAGQKSARAEGQP
jgi:tetratricopeptide (TPR) repeat protein